MTPETLLYRQIHPDFVQNDRPTSQAFRPTSKDENKLSAYDGDKIQPQASWEHYTGELGLASSGVMAITNGECTAQNLAVTADGTPFPEHCLIDFSGLTNEPGVKKAAKNLQASAIQRGWRFRNNE